MTVAARDLKNDDTTDAGFDLLIDTTTIGAVTGDAGVTRILFGAAGVDGGFAPGDATNGLDVDVTRLPALATGSNVIGAVTQSGTWNVTVNVALPAGTNNIGDVDVLTLPAIPAGTNNIGDVDVLTLPSGSIAATTAKTADLDSGVGTDTVALFGVAVAASGGAVAITGDTTNGLDVDVTRLPALAAGTNNIGDVDVLTLPALATGSNVIGAVTQSGTWNVTVNVALPAGTNNIGDVDVLTLPALPAGTNNIGDVDVLTLPALSAGTNNIGDVDVLTLPAIPAGTNNIGDVDVLTQPSRVATTDSITAKLATDAIQNGLTAVTPAFVPIDAATSGNNTVVSAQTSKKIRVVSAFFVASGTVGSQWQSGASGTKLTGRQRWTAQTGVSLPFNPTGWFETASGQLLNLNLDAAIGAYGSLSYIAV